MSEQGPSPEFMLVYRQMMIDGLQRESEITKKVLAAVPETKSSYKPDPNSRSAWELAWHLADSDVQFLDGIADLNFETAFAPRAEADKPKTVAAVVEWYDQNMKRGLERVSAMSAEQLMTPISFFNVYNLPAAFYLGFLNNHCIHHRGELATYLRPMGSKVPSIYGGSYDEPWQPPAADETAA